ncbi:MAG: Rv2175c family DNA-binding protein [Nostocoides sp.]
MTEPTSAAAADRSLEELVEEWLSIPDVAERLGVRLSDVRRMLADRLLLSHRVGERQVLAVPAAFIDAEGVLASLEGTLTVLADSGLNDEEALRWLFTVDESLPLGGTPVDNLRGGRKTEIRRRAMELAL